MNLSQIINTKLNPVNVKLATERMPVAIPKTTPKLETKYFDSYPRPMSVGSDGAVYGVLGGAKTDVIFRTTDGFNTAPVEGYNFSTEASPKGVVFVTKLGNKYIVVTRNAADFTGAIWTSDSFNSGFTRVVNITNAFPETLGISWYHGVLPREQVLLIGEYGQTGTKKKLHATFNGGVTWKVIKETTVINSAKNSHFHHSVYDPYRGRIWASQGDGENARLSYSDDLGSTWKDVPVASNNLGVTLYQPTLIVPLPTKVVMAPDTDSIVPSVLSLERDTSFTRIGTEKFNLSLDHAVWDGDYGFNQYGQPPFVIDKNETYMLYPNFSGKKRNIIVASGDGGTTWHNVVTANLQDLASGSLSSGLIGPDSNGFIYAYLYDSNPKVLKMSKVEWLYK